MAATAPPATAAPDVPEKAPLNPSAAVQDHWPNLDAAVAAFFAFGVLVLTIVGATIPQLVDKLNPNHFFSLWSMTLCPGGTGSGSFACQITATQDFACSGLGYQLMAAAAFAIISILLALAAFVLIFLEATGNSVNPYAGAGLSFGTAATLAVSWGIVAGARNTKFCQGPYLFDQYDYAPGFAILASAFAIALLNLIILLRRNVEAVRNNFDLFLVVILLANTVVGTIIGTSTTQFVDRNHGESTISLWQQHLCVFEGSWSSCTTSSVSEMACKTQADQLRASSAFAVISIVLSSLAFVFSFLDFIGHGLSTAATTAVSAATAVTLTVSWGIVAGQYDTFLCSTGIKVSQQYAFGAGYALLVAAFVTASFAVIVLVRHIAGAAAPSHEPAATTTK